MFVCKECLHESTPIFSTSYGPCEMCHKTTLCADIHHSRVLLKGEHWEKSVHGQYIAVLNFPKRSLEYEKEDFERELRCTD